MPIYLIETDAFNNPLDPVGGWFGPINPEIAVDWIAYEEDCNGEFKIVPEIEFPSERHYRRDDWLCVGVRPPRPMPRGLRLYLQADNATGTPPPGLIGSGVPCWDPNPASAAANLAYYSDSSNTNPICEWRFESNVNSHATSVNPLAYVADDFVLESIGLYTATDGSDWRLLIGPKAYAGESPLVSLPIPALAIARRRLGTPVDKTRSIVLFDGGSCDDVCECWPGGSSPRVIAYHVTIEAFNFFTTFIPGTDLKTCGGDSPDWSTDLDNLVWDLTYQATFLPGAPPACLMTTSTWELISGEQDLLIDGIQSCVVRAGSRPPPLTIPCDPNEDIPQVWTAGFFNTIPAGFCGYKFAFFTPTDQRIQMLSSGDCMFQEFDHTYSSGLAIRNLNDVVCGGGDVRVRGTLTPL